MSILLIQYYDYFEFGPALEWPNRWNILDPINDHTRLSTNWDVPAGKWLTGLRYCSPHLVQ